MKHHKVTKEEIESQEFFRYIESKRIENLMYTYGLINNQTLGDSRNGSIKESKSEVVCSKSGTPQNNIEKLCKLYVDLIFYPRKMTNDETSNMKENKDTPASKILFKSKSITPANKQENCEPTPKISDYQIEIKRPNTSKMACFSNLQINSRFAKLKEAKAFKETEIHDDLANRKSSFQLKLDSITRSKLVKSSSMDDISETSSTFKIGTMTIQSRNQNESATWTTKLHNTKSRKSNSSINSKFHKALGLRQFSFGSQRMNYDIKLSVNRRPMKQTIRFNSSCKELKMFEFSSLPNLEEKELWKPRELSISCRHYGHNQFKLRSLKNSA